jgi:hypothetical protein
MSLWRKRQFNDMIKLFEQEYTGDQIERISTDIEKAFDPIHTAAVLAIPMNEDESMMGKFRVKIEWIDA